MSRFRAGAASAALAAALAGAAVAARAGTALEQTGIVEILLVVASAAIVCAALLTGPPRRGYGVPAVAAFAALTAVTALSIGWSVDPDASLIETGRTLSYLAVFAAAVAAARVAPTAAPVVVRGILLATVFIAAYGLAARVWPGSFDESIFGGRISQPFDYWNALAGAAMVGIVPALWLGSRRTGTALGRALAYPAIGTLIAALLIAQSRGALVAAAIASALWVAIVPLRLRSLVVLGVGAAGAAPVAAWALSKDPFRLALEPISAREAVAGDFGLLLAAMVVALLVAGAAVQAIAARWRPSLRTRNRVGVAIAATTALLCLGLLTSVSLSDRGLTGTVADRVDDFTSDDAAPPVGGARFGSTSSERGEYWGLTLDVFGERPSIGQGAGAFEIARLRYRDDPAMAAHTHGFVHQTLADLGWVGAATVLALLAAWLVAAARAVGIGRRRRGGRSEWTAERAALAALALTAVAYGAQSVADWTWFVPGLTAIGLVAAGFVAGRGALAPVGAVEGTREPLRLRPTPPRVAAAVATAVLALVGVWTIWQPVAADRAVARSYELLEAGEPEQALGEAAEARDANPYSKDALYARADALAAMGRRADALRTLGEAVRENPRDSDPWLRVATFHLSVLGSAADALESAFKGLTVDPHSQALIRVRDQATAEIQAQMAQ